MDNQIAEREFNWDDVIENDSGEFSLLPEGDYRFVVTDFSRERFSGSEKMPPCPMAKLSIKVLGNGESTTVLHTLLLHSKTEWKLSEFFRSIGQKKKGEKLRMDWSKVINATGYCKVVINQYTNRYGEQKTNNKIEKFYPADEYLPNQQLQQEKSSHASPNAFGASWKPGNF